MYRFLGGLSYNDRGLAVVYNLLLLIVTYYLIMNILKNESINLIPCFNEIETIAEILIKVNEQKNILKEIIIIDDASTDGTKKLKNELSSYYDILIENDSNQGKGFSLRRGIKFASGDIILIQDADLEYEPNDYQKILNPILTNKAMLFMDPGFQVHRKKGIVFLALIWKQAANFII